jgi:hypothetical protein
MNSQEMRFATDAKKICNFLLVRLLLVLGGGKSKRFTFSFYPVKLTYDFMPVATASGGMSCVQPYLI